MKEYRCTRNAPYTHDCIGHHDLRARQGYYIWATCAEDAWQQMAKRFPDEVEVGFTIQDWESFSVVVVEVKRDDQGNVVSSDRVPSKSAMKRD